MLQSCLSHIISGSTVILPSFLLRVLFSVFKIYMPVVWEKTLDVDGGVDVEVDEDEFKTRIVQS
jgi:hypothetical protein